MSALRDEGRRRAARDERPRELLVERGETVIIEPVVVNGQEMTRYSVVSHENTIDEWPDDTPESVRVALNLAGAWSDLDGDAMEEALYRIRHDSVPTPPIDLDDE